MPVHPSSLVPKAVPKSRFHILPLTQSFDTLPLQHVSGWLSWQVTSDVRWRRADLANQVQKVLETANVKLAAVATDVLGKSGRTMLEAMVGGETDAGTLAELARGRLRAKLPELRQALEGRVEAHHRFLLARLLEHIDFLETTLQKVQEEIDGRLGPYAEATERLQTIPGVGPLAAATILAEIGVDMSRFPTAKHLAWWAGLCPGNKASRANA